MLDSLKKSVLLSSRTILGIAVRSGSCAVVSLIERAICVIFPNCTITLYLIQCDEYQPPLPI